MYFTDVKNIPSTDLATMERLWNQFSGGKFGYSVQKVRLEKKKRKNENDMKSNGCLFLRFSLKTDTDILYYNIL